MVGGHGLHNREGSGEAQGQKKKGKDITATRGISVRGKKLRGPSRSNPPRQKPDCQSDQQVKT